MCGFASHSIKPWPASIDPIYSSDKQASSGPRPEFEALSLRSSELLRPFDMRWKVGNTFRPLPRPLCCFSGSPLALGPEGIVHHPSSIVPSTASQLPVVTWAIDRYFSLIYVVRSVWSCSIRPRSIVLASLVPAPVVILQIHMYITRLTPHSNGLRLLHESMNR
jgi:hypothetical protein